jgi:hypothetical protein
MKLRIFLNQILHGKDVEKNKRLLEEEIAKLLHGKVKYPYTSTEIANVIVNKLI